MCDHTWIEDTVHGARERHFVCCHCKAELTKSRTKPFLMFESEEKQVISKPRLEPETPDADRILKQLGLI